MCRYKRGFNCLRRRLASGKGLLCRLASVTLSRCVCVSAALVSAAKVMRCIQCSLVPTSWPKSFHTRRHRCEHVILRENEVVRVRRWYRWIGRYSAMCNGSAAICNAKFWLGVPIPKISASRGGPGPLSNTMLLGITRVPLPNGISFCPTALAGCTSMTDGQTDRQRYGNVCHNMRNR